MPARSKVAILFMLLNHASAITPAIPVGDDAKNAAMTQGDLRGLHLVITCVHDSAAMNMMDKDGNMLPWQEWVRKPPPSSPSLTTISFNCRRYARTAPALTRCLRWPSRAPSALTRCSWRSRCLRFSTDNTQVGFTVDVIAWVSRKSGFTCARVQQRSLVSNQRSSPGHLTHVPLPPFLSQVRAPRSYGLREQMPEAGGRLAVSAASLQRHVQLRGQ